AGAVRAAFGLEITAAEAALRPSTHADYQCNAAMGLAKRLGHPPREIAARLAEQLAGELIEPPQVSGPGFINLTLRHDWLEQRVAGLLGDNRLGVPITDAPRRIALDYSSPNVAKEM